MEVSVISALNLPQDSIISIRSGETRRQAPFKLNQVFRFPHGSSNPFKVDVFAPLGHHNVNANSLQEGKNSLKLCMNSIELDLKIVKGTNGNTGDVKNERLNSALQARSYLDEHDLVSSLQLMLQEVIKNKPSDPMDYMIGYLGRNKTSPPEPKEAAPKEAAPAAPAAKAEKPAAPASAEEPKREAKPVPEAAPPAAAPAAAPAADDSNTLEEELEVEAEVEVEVELELEAEAEMEAEVRRRKGSGTGGGGGGGGAQKAVDGAPPAKAAEQTSQDAAARAKDEIVAGAIKGGGSGEAYMEDELELELEAELEAEMELEMEMELEAELRMKQRGG